MKITLVTSDLVEQFPNIHSSLGSSLSTEVHPCNPNTQEEEAGGSQVQGNLLLQSWFSSSLGYLRLYLKKKEEETEKEKEERKEDQQRMFLKEEANTNDKELSEENWESSAH